MRRQPETAINTYTGKVLNLAEPQPDQVALEDIAWGLSRICRFGAQALQFYSVAQHAITVCETVQRLGRKDLALAALHHDSHEAYSCDVPRPLKLLLNNCYAPVTQSLDRAIAEALGVEFPEQETDDEGVIKAADNAIFVLEAAALLRDGGRAARASMEIDREALEAAGAVVGEVAGWDFGVARTRFAEMHEGLRPHEEQ